MKMLKPRLNLLDVNFVINYYVIEAGAINGKNIFTWSLVERTLNEFRSYQALIYRQIV